MKKVKFCSRIGAADIYTNPYYNNPYYVQTRSKKATGTNYQCVYWAYQRSQEIGECKICYFGDETPECCEDAMPLLRRRGFGNGCEFYSDALWPKSTTNPQVGDIVCYGKDWGGGYGHVRIIEKIDDDYIYMSGANEDFKGNIKFGIKLEREKAIGGGASARGLQGFIHNPHILTQEEEEEQAIDYKSLYEKEHKKLEKLTAKFNEIQAILNVD